MEIESPNPNQRPGKTSRRERQIMVGGTLLLVTASVLLAIVVMMPVGPTLDGDVGTVFAGFWWLQVVTIGAVHVIARRVFPDVPAEDAKT